jgi:pimeloyl-ACP methyl ester carboxylesterase
MTPFLTSDGSTLHYEIIGKGPRIALTPGGREAGRVLMPLVEQLAQECCVLTWDRRNSGASDLYFETARSEYEIWADDLAELLAGIGFAPAVIAGGSAGCRVSVNAAMRHPAIARAMILWSVSGGPFAAHFLGHIYHEIYIEAAKEGGMAAVAETPFFAARVAENPANRERLLAMDPARFIDAMRRWNEAFHTRPNDPIAGVSSAVASIRVPTLIFDGNDDIHPPMSAETMAALIPTAHLVPSPWRRDEWMSRFNGTVPGSIFDLYPLLVPQMLEFIRSLAAPHAG